MLITKLDKKIVNRFFELREKTYIACSAVEKKEYSKLKDLIKEHQPELLELKEAPLENQVSAESETLNGGLTKTEAQTLKELNSKFPDLDSDLKRQREHLRNKARQYKLTKTRKELAEDNIELGDTLKELVEIISIMSQALAPQLFKSVSAAGLDMAEIQIMHQKAKLLNERING